MRKVQTRVAAFAVTIVLCALSGGEVRGQANTAAGVVQAAATAMGGADRLKAVRNITLRGYGMYVYQNGAGRITGEPEAPEKYIAANDMERIYDLEHNRLRISERRNNLFPFLGIDAHAWNQQVQGLDGDTLVNVQQARAVRGATGGEQARQRRIWLWNNPAAMIRAMMDSSARLSPPRREGAVQVIDVTLANGDKFSTAFRVDNLPAWIRWVQPVSSFGQLTFTTHFTGWADASGTAGFLLPLGYVTRQDYRNVDFLKIYVDAYSVDTHIPDLSAPAAAPAQTQGGPGGGGRAGGPGGAAAPITSKQIGKGIWRVDQGGTMVIEFADHLVIYELNINVDTAKRVLAHARSLAPGKPIRYYVTSHNHQDHTNGMRQAVAEGITVVQRKGSETQLREMAEHRAPDYPDDQERNRAPFKFLAVDTHLRMSDATQTIDIYAVPQNGHMADAIIVYIPSEKMMMEGDLVSASLQLQHWPDGFRDVIARYKLDVEWVAPVHPDALQPGQGKYTKAYVEEFLKAGTDRAREHCKKWLDVGVYHSGCPVQTKYY